MGTDAREVVLHAIRQALQGQAPISLPPATSFDGSPLPLDVLAKQFCIELRALGGDATVVDDAPACARAIDVYLEARGARRVATQSGALAQAIGDLLQRVQASPVRGLSPSSVERFDASLLEAQALVADTGSVIVHAMTYEERLLPYLPRICVIVSPLSGLHATLGGRALAPIERATTARERGEAVIVTGPSRTADIEKTLVLGAHGPADLAVFLVR
jgi:L-lactate dehydrogenase complex protein LldG